MKAYPLSLDGMPPPPKRRRWRRFVDHSLPTIVIYLMVLTLLGAVLFPFVVQTVPSGNIGVLWKRFGGGTVLDPRALKDEGIHFIWPWNELFLYNLRLQSVTETYNAISSDGVSLGATLIIRFRLKRDAIPVLHQAIGPSYEQLMVRPGIGSLTREIMAQFTAEQVYSTARQEIQDKIRDRTEERLSDKMMEREGEGEGAYRVSLRDTIVIYDTLVHGIELPALVVGAINRKTEQYYISEEYKFRVEREKRESERKKIEADGIREFQTIVSQGISESYLRWRGIEATLQLSQSTNSKVVIIGSAKDGLPIILGGVDTPAPAGGAAAPTENDGAAPKPTAAGPSVPLEKTPSGALTKPAEKMPSKNGPAAEKMPSKNGPAAAGGAEEPRSSLWPLSLPHIEGLLSRITGASEPKPESKEESAKAPAAAKQ
jgi:regulator of protease activity HflC (stomatin/prohibitin superfamily)